MAAYPWQEENDRKIVRALCGSKTLTLEIQANIQKYIILNRVF